MMINEFEERTGYYPSVEEYKVIEEFYLEFGGDKDEFCKAFKKNTDFLAQKIQTEVNRRYFKSQEDARKEVLEVEKEKAELLRQIEDLKASLEKEQEWKPYEMTENVSQEDYDNLKDAGGTKELSETEAKDILYSWFGFAREAVTIIRSVPAYEINRHRQLRRTGEIERKPLYNATDWNYIRFDCGQMSWELCNDGLRPFFR